MINPNEPKFKKCGECNHFFVCANLYGEVNVNTIIKNVKGRPCFYFEDNKIKINKSFSQITYAEWLLPKLKWASSVSCDKLDYTQKRLNDAILCIERLVNLIQNTNHN